MKLTSVIIAGVAILTPATQALYANVINHCTFPAFVQSVPYDPSSPPGILTKLVPGQEYSEKFNLGGSTLKMGTTAQLAYPLFGGYSLGTNPFLIYYELQDKFGNPFAAYPNAMFTGNSTCARFNCSANDASCYSDGGANMKVYNCMRPTNVTVSLCRLDRPL